MSYFVAIEAADCMGKSVQSRLVVQCLNNNGIKSICIEPIRNNHLIRYMLKTGSAITCQNMFQCVQFLNRLIFQTTMLKQLLKEYQIIVIDRWKLSSLVYGEATGVNTKLSLLFYRLLRTPDITIVLQGQPFASDTKDSYENDNVLQNKVKKLYRSLCNVLGRTYAVNANGTPKEVTERILECLKERNHEI